MTKVWFWLKNSRLFSLPMTVFSWLVIFVYSSDGNIINGIAALFGIAFTHLATNLFDDYIDYKNLPKDCQKSKCSYIKEGKASINDVLRVVIIYLSIATIMGLFLFLRCGFPVIILAIIGGAIALSYSILSKIGFSEIAVGITFGPLLFEGVYFVMTGTFSFTVFIISLAVVMFTIGLMYVHTVLDYEGDLKSGKKTIACRLGTKEKAETGIFFVYGIGYLFTIISVILLENYYLLITFSLIPLIIYLQKYIKTFRFGSKQTEFLRRLLFARNIMIYYSLIFTFCLILNKLNI